MSPPLDPANVHEDVPFEGHTVLDGRSVRKFQIHGYSPGAIFDAVAEELATLTIPGRVTSRDVIDVSCFRKYIAANAVGWYKGVNEVGGRQATNGDLRIVVGGDRCSSWSRLATASAAVYIPDHESPTTRSFVQFNVGVNADGLGVLYIMQGNRRIRDPEGVVYQNQSVFLRTLNISVCDDIWSQLTEDYRPRIDPYMRPLPEGTTFTWRSHSIGMHPANGINALLLKQRPRAKFAITQDSDWISVLKPDDPTLPCASEFLSRILEVYNVCEEDDVVFLEYKPEVLYRNYLTHDHHMSLTLPLWQPTVVEVGAVGYLSREDENFVTLFNACAPDDAIFSLPPVQTEIVTQPIQSVKSNAFDVSRADESTPSQRVFFPLKVGEKVARLYTGPTQHRQFQADNAPTEWFKSNIKNIIEIYGADHNVTGEDLVLITETLCAQDYALFVSACHQEGSVTFDIDVEPQIGQPWGAFLPAKSGQFTSKVSRHGGPWNTVLVSCLRVASNVVSLLD
ncbi:hypothetical protein M413DRAFT_447506 [Hebeloma cylindrosporum]|uniref:Uncharacterized protein n=1 Tax=Hebeloma cylindrosporum TaxID=76867 RepID=A0A0C2XM37_HEBCY|nr:hypothetical protein M413DRAFT_447506 [Hebeloma cylindrosporum h7]